MAKRRKLGREAGTAECFYCGKDVPEKAWKCPYCGKWYSDGKVNVSAISVIAILVLVLVGYAVAPYFESSEESGGTTPSYSIEIRTHGQYESHSTGPGESTGFMIFARNRADVPDGIDFSFEGVATGLNPHLEYPYKTMAADSLFLNILTVDVDSFLPLGTYSVTVVATSRGDSSVTDSVEVSVQVVNLQPGGVEAGDYVQCDYILWLSDGSVKDSRESLKVYTGTGEIDPQWKENGYMDVIEGFRQALLDMKITETKVVLVPPSLGYTTGELAGQNLYFQITLISIDG